MDVWLITKGRTQAHRCMGCSGVGNLRTLGVHRISASSLGQIEGTVHEIEEHPHRQPWPWVHTSAELARHGRPAGHLRLCTLAFSVRVVPTGGVLGLIKGSDGRRQIDEHFTYRRRAHGEW